MNRRFTWEIKKNYKHQYSLVRLVKVSSNKLKKNQLICSMLEEGWEVLKVKISQKDENLLYQYYLGKQGKNTN